MSHVPDVAWQEMAVRARHRLYLRVAFSRRRLERLERSKAVERLEQASV
jgi:hypothetical protein